MKRVASGVRAVLLLVAVAAGWEGCVVVGPEVLDAAAVGVDAALEGRL
jgi:hypothetical protein